MPMDQKSDEKARSNNTKPKIAERIDTRIILLIGFRINFASMSRKKSDLVHAHWDILSNKWISLPNKGAKDDTRRETWSLVLYKFWYWPTDMDNNHNPLQKKKTKRKGYGNTFSKRNGTPHLTKMRTTTRTIKHQNMAFIHQMNDLYFVSARGCKASPSTILGSFDTTNLTYSLSSLNWFRSFRPFSNFSGLSGISIETPKICQMECEWAIIINRGQLN